MNEKYTKFIEEANEAIRASSMESSVYIGCDSLVYKKNKRWMAKYSTVVVVHKDSKHGCQIYHYSEDMDDFKNLKQRLLNEVNFAVTAASDILDSLGSRHLEIHLDLNPDPKHKSYVAIKEAIGWVRGTIGIEPQVKPDSWCSTHAADHAVRHLH